MARYNRSDEVSYLSYINQLKRRLSKYEPIMQLESSYKYSHCFVVLNKCGEYKIKVLKWKPIYRVGHIDSFGWLVVLISEQTSLFCYDYVYGYI